MLKTISVILPAHNESDNINDCFSQLALLLNRLPCYKIKIVFVNDCSTDNTLNMLRRLRKEKSGVSIINLRARYGEWIAFRIALASFDSDYAVQLPADLQIPPGIVCQFTSKMEENPNLDVVYGEGFPRDKGIFPAVYWFYLFLRFRGKITGRQVDCFMINRRTIDSIVRSASFCNIIPLDIFKARDHDFITFEKSRRIFGTSKYRLKSKVRMFAETVLLSIGLKIFRFRRPEYEILD